MKRYSPKSLTLIRAKAKVLRQARSLLMDPLRPDISVGGVGPDGSTTYVIEDFQTVTTTVDGSVDGSVIVTPIFVQLGTFFSLLLLTACQKLHRLTIFQHEDTIPEGSSQFSAYFTEISFPYTYQDTCSMSDSSLQCVETG
jgi:hypothetical protein